MRIARVEPLTTARALRGPFDYLLPDDFEQVSVGTRLIVPFAGRKLESVVVELDDSSELPVDRLASPISVASPAIPAELVALALRVASAYCSTPARALQLVAPPGRAGGAGPQSALHSRLTAEGREALEGDQRLTEGQRAALESLLGGPLRAKDVPGGTQVLRRLEARGLVEIESLRVTRRPASDGYDPGRVRPALNADQESVLAEVVSALDRQPSGGGILLHGVTGSGKTEIYLGAAEQALRLGRGVLVLVPEIALTPQAVARFSARLGDTVAVIHSGLSAGERYDEWTRLADRDARVCVGPRSAVFAPVMDLGLMIVDEEHESAYRNDGDPGYDAREVARWRAEAAGALLIAGSATPRPESVRRLRRLRLDRRADGAPMPPVELLDMKGVRGALHPVTVDALAGVKREGGKAIVLLNRRGWSNYLSCGSCGHVWVCPECDVTLVLHRNEGFIGCHHCGHREPVPESCSECGSASVSRHGSGTERIESQIRSLVGSDDFPVLRLDADSTSRKGSAADLLTSFQSARAGVLIGTQMVAKGHDFPDVTLGVVVDADSTLRFPDFRSEERTFQLVTQLAGRAGRGPGGGRVLVQTSTPDSPVLMLAAKHDSDGFLEEELGRRDALGYPPAAAIVKVQLAAESEPDVEAVAATVVELLESAGMEPLGPAPLFRLRGRHRRQILVRSGDRDALVRSVEAAVAGAAATPAGRRSTIGTDVDAG